MVVAVRKPQKLHRNVEFAPVQWYKPASGSAHKVLQTPIWVEDFADETINTLIETNLRGVRKRRDRNNLVLKEGVFIASEYGLGGLLVLIEYDFKHKKPLIEIPGKAMKVVEDMGYERVSCELLQPTERKLLEDRLFKGNSGYTGNYLIWPGNLYAGTWQLKDLKI